MLNQIHKITGQKVTADDPIVAAALINSQLIRQAGMDAQATIHFTVAEMLADLSNAVKLERQAAAHAYQEAMESAQTP